MNQALYSIVCAAVLIAPQALQARDRAPAKDTAVKDETIVPANVPAYVLKNRSTFNSPGDAARVPFWPVGWSKTKQAAIAVAAAAPEAKETFDVKSLVVTGILLGSGTTSSFALINGRSYGEGEYLRMPKGARTRVRVGRINDGAVVLEYENQKIVVPLRRFELNQHKAEEELLDQTR
jgi:type II secretory pathway component PulC